MSSHKAAMEEVRSQSSLRIKQNSASANAGTTCPTMATASNMSHYRKTVTTDAVQNYYDQRSSKARDVDESKNFTEVFSWGNDKFGQLGLGQRLSQGKQMHSQPRFCSYNIPISKIACG